MLELENKFFRWIQRKKIGHLYLFCSSEREDGTGKESRSSFNICCRTCHKSSQSVILHCGANKLGQLKTTWINKSSQAGSWNYHATDTQCINYLVTKYMYHTALMQNISDTLFRHNEGRYCKAHSIVFSSYEPWPIFLPNTQ